MANMAVAYRGPDPSLVTLTNELRARYGNPARTYEFVTGYKAASNYSGHNPDSNGVVHAVDIFTDDHGNIPEAEGRALAERLRLVGAATNRFAYLIHDMSAGAPQPMIAGQHTGWLWAAYGGADAHSDHIHLSISDGYWGDPCTVPAHITNDTSRWGINSGVAPQADTITPITNKGFLMALTDAEQTELLLNVRKIVGIISTVNDIKAKLDRYLDTKISAVAEKVVSFKFPKLGLGVDKKGQPIKDETSVGTELGWNAANVKAAGAKVEQLKATK